MTRTCQLQEAEVVNNSHTQLHNFNNILRLTLLLLHYQQEAYYYHHLLVNTNNQQVKVSEILTYQQHHSSSTSTLVQHIATGSISQYQAHSEGDQSTTQTYNK